MRDGRNHPHALRTISSSPLVGRVSEEKCNKQRHVASSITIQKRRHRRKIKLPLPLSLSTLLSPFPVSFYPSLEVEKDARDQICSETFHPIFHLMLCSVLVFGFLEELRIFQNFALISFNIVFLVLHIHMIIQNLYMLLKVIRIFLECIVSVYVYYD